jgi:hypothetical protein
MIELTTTNGTRYTLDDNGAVVARTDGPEGWDYSGKWKVLGFLTRANSRYMVPLADAVAGAWIGHGFVVDLDHGTLRVWMGSPGRCKAVRHAAQ